MFTGRESFKSKRKAEKAIVTKKRSEVQRGREGAGRVGGEGNPNDLLSTISNLETSLNEIPQFCFSKGGVLFKGDKVALNNFVE